jgi:ABC-type transporter Mla subunit MlaD
MGHQVFEWVIAIAVLVIFIANMVFLALTYKMLKPLIAKLQVTNDRINPILSEVQGIISDNRGKITTIVSESQPVVRDIVIKTDEIAAKVSGIISDAQPIVRDIGTKANDITGATRDIVLTVKNRVERLDELVRRTTDKIDSTTTTVQKQVTEPVREISYLGVAIKRAILTLFARNSKTAG